MTAIMTRPASQGSHAPSGTPEGRGAVAFVWAGLRLALGWVFLWAFLDKMFGWGYSTASANAWVNGGSPTEGFLTFGTSGPFANFYQGMAGSVLADVLFMVGLAGLGVALVAGIGMRIAAGTGALLMLLMWSASLPPDTNPFLTYHLIYAGLFIALALVYAGDTLGLGRWWSRTTLVQRMPWLR
jgi:thiosulfate dehydrogenase (quinone) large subunit